MVDMAMLSFGLTLSGVVTGMVVWGARLEGKVMAHDTLFAEREKLVEAHHAEMTTRLDRIERKIDNLK